MRGWVQAVRDQKRVQFVIVRDEAGAVQAVLSKDEPPSALNDAISALTPESAVTVSGSDRGERAGQARRTGAAACRI